MPPCHVAGLCFVWAALSHVAIEEVAENGHPKGRKDAKEVRFRFTEETLMPVRERDGHAHRGG